MPKNKKMDDDKKKYDLSGKNIVVTGATSGIGLAAVKAFVSSGAYVIGVGRSVERNEKAQAEIISTFPQAKIEYLLADLESQAQVKSLSKTIIDLLVQNGEKHLDALVNNAGTYLEKKQMTEDGIEKTFAVNHLAPFILTHGLLKMLMNAEHGRVIAVSSYSHFTTPLCLSRIANPWPYISLMAYKRSKLSNVLFTYALNRRFERLEAFAVDPGLVNTSIASKGSQGISHWVWRSRRKKGTPPETPAKTILFLCAEDKINTTKGFYFKDCKPKVSSKKSRRKDLADDLLALSCILTGLSWD